MDRPQEPERIQRIHRIHIRRVPPDKPNPYAIDEFNKYKLDRLESEHDELKLKNQSLKQDIGLRKKYTRRTFYLICWWLIGILCILILSGFKLIDISDNVLIALIGGTTINVIGIFLVVAKYIFSR